MVHGLRHLLPSNNGEHFLIEGKYGLRDGGREVRREGRWEGRRREGGREVLKIINTLMILQGHGLMTFCLRLNLFLYKKSIKNLLPRIIF